MARRGWDVISVDIDPLHNATHTVDVLRFPYKTIPVPDYVWASPPCTTYSHANGFITVNLGPDVRCRTTQRSQTASYVTLNTIRYWMSQNQPAVLLENLGGISKPSGNERTGAHDYPILVLRVSHTQHDGFWIQLSAAVEDGGSNGTHTIRIGKDRMASCVAGRTRGTRRVSGGTAGSHPSAVSSILTQMSKPWTDDGTYFLLTPGSNADGVHRPQHA